MLFYCAALTASLRADALEDWSTAYLRALQSENTSPPLGARCMAIYSVAVADAVNAVERCWQPYLYSCTNVSTNIDREAVIAGAAYRTAQALFPSRRSDFDELWAAARANLQATSARAAGFQLGFLSAETILEARSADGSNAQMTYVPRKEAGAWRRTPPWHRPPDLPHWGGVRPFVLHEPGQFRPPGPPSLTGDRYAADYSEVLRIGGKNSAVRTADQSQAAQFWSDFTGTVTPPGHWTQITLALARSNHLSLKERVHLLALVHLALADGGIACWDAKYAFNFWRPVTASRADDGNPATQPDPEWEPMLPTPPFPDYVSGHSTFSAAAAEVLRRWFKRDNLEFDISSDTAPGIMRHFHSLTEAAIEIGNSRIWGGIHFRSADLDGQELGRMVGGWVFEHALSSTEPGNQP